MTTKGDSDLIELPLIPMPPELSDLPPLPKEEDDRMRTLARYAVEQIVNKYKSRGLQYTNDAKRSISNG